VPPQRAHMIVRMFAALLIATASASAATPPPGPVNDPALVAAAQAEGALQVYGVGPAAALDAKAKRFEATYGIKVAALRLGGTSIPPRLLVEQRSGNAKTDVVIGESGLETEQIKRAGLYAQYRPPENKDLIAGTFDPDGYWSAHQVYTETICYNPVKLKAAGIKPPASWEDLTAKEWHGQFALFTGSWEWYAAMKRFYGADRADALMRGYAANAPRLQSSHQIGVDLTATGEVLASANAFGYTCLIAKAKGQPVELVNPVPTVIELGTVGVLASAPHPNAARLFERWLLSREIEQWAVQTLGETVPRKDVPNDPRVLNARVKSLISDMTNLDAINADIKSFNAIYNIP
jgi:iron(III) transport system substrate-binding protein